MKLKIFTIGLLLFRVILGQDQISVELSDSIIVYANSSADANSDLNTLNLDGNSNASLTSYDLLSSLSILGASYQSDFNVLPSIEAAEFQEQNYLIESIPMMFPMQMLGVQSGMNSLMFSSIAVERNSSNNNFSRPITLNAGIKRFDYENPIFESKTSNLHTENLLYVPLRTLNSKIIIGYTRSLLESMKPLFNEFIKDESFNFNSFPYYEGFQTSIISEFENLKMTNLLILSNDNGITQINSKKFDFNSNSLSIGSKIEMHHRSLSNTFTFFYLKGKNNINYNFRESANRVSGEADLLNLNSGATLNTKLNLNKRESIIINLGYKYDKGNSQNKASYTYSIEKVYTNYSLHNYESTIKYQRILSNSSLLSLTTGINRSSSQRKLGYIANLDFYNSFDGIINFNLIFDYKSSYIPTNSIFHTFQNSVWDPSSVNTLYFIDQDDLPIEPIRNINIIAYLEKKFVHSWFSLNIQLKTFYRIAKNLIFSNNYPLESTYYNTDFSFNQNYNSKKYGIILSFSQYFPHISLTNRTSLALIESLNINEKNNLSHRALNYNPITISNILNWNWGNLSVSPFFIYKLGRFIFNKNLETFFSYSDSSIAYSVKTDLHSQKSLDSQLRFDIAINYLLFNDPIRFDVGLSVINVFNSEFESNRIYYFDEHIHRIGEKSEYINLPRFLILSLNLFYAL